jgi:hypothetical protein
MIEEAPGANRSQLPGGEGSANRYPRAGGQVDHSRLDRLGHRLTRLSLRHDTPVVLWSGTAEGSYPERMAISTAVDAAAVVRHLQEDGNASDEDLWRFGILQLLDDYESVRASDGLERAAALLTAEPPMTGHSGFDAAVAALVCWLADRDRWTAPPWSYSNSRVAKPWWFVTPSAYGRTWAMVQSPAQFRIRGVFITNTALLRA